MGDSRQRRYPPELRERAVRMVFETIDERGGVRQGVVTEVAKRLGVGPESLRSWVHQAEVDGGRRVGTSGEDKRRISELELRDARRDNEILKAAASFFARELDPRRAK
jgi:transposase